MPLHHVEPVMGTTISIDVVDSSDEALVDELVHWFHHVDEVFSPYKETSTVTRIGRGLVGPGDPELTDDVLEVLSRCEALVAETDGVFDVWNLPSPTRRIAWCRDTSVLGITTSLSAFAPTR